LDCAITSCGQQTELHPSRMLSLPGQSPVRHEKLSGGLTCKMTLSLLSGFCQGFSRLKLSLPQIFRAVRFQNPPPPTRCGGYRLHHVRGPLGRSRGIPTASFPSMLPRPPRHFRSAISGPQVDTAGPLMGYSGIYRGHPPPALLAPSSSANGPWTGQGGRGGGPAHVILFILLDGVSAATPYFRPSCFAGAARQEAHFQSFQRWVPAVGCGPNSGHRLGGWR